nr:hypothetical protein CFP56_32351 [Quercus suber]
MSGGGNNATISVPGPTWQMLWPAAFDEFQLDIVGFLAILGEGSVSHNAQVAALSRLFYLPRLIPAPQALLWPNRPMTLPSTKANVTAVHSGNTKDHIHHVAHVLLGDVTYQKASKSFTVRCVRIKKNPEMSAGRLSLSDRFFRGLSKKAREVGKRSTVKAKATGPLSWVTLLGFFLALSLFIISIALGDGMSLIATMLLSLLSTLVGIGNKWELQLQKRAQDSAIPQANGQAAPSSDRKAIVTREKVVIPVGDVVIRYPNGSFLVVKCDETIARELYFAPEEINYNIKRPELYRVISLIGTLMLMFGVISLANARLQLQFAWAGAYVLINAAQWTAAALPARSHWDLSCYQVIEQGLEEGPKNDNFTEALWKAILLTRSSEWVERGGAAPRTKTWDEWLKEAADLANKAEDFVGPLVDPNRLWKGGDPDNAIIWRLPPSTDWKPKAAWDEINKKHHVRKQNPRSPRRHETV